MRARANPFWRWAAGGLAVLAGAGQLAAAPLTLAECLRETFEHNPQILQARLTLEQAAGQRLVYRSRALPTFQLSGLAGQQGKQNAERLRVVGLDANGNRTVTETVNERPSTLFLIGSEALNQPIFDASIPAAWRRGDVTLAVARSNFLVTATALLHQARVQFYQALFQQENGALLREVAGSLAANVQGEAQLQQAGLAGRQALVAAQVQAANFQPGIFATTGSLREGLAALWQTMGRPLGAGADPIAEVRLDAAWEDGDFTFDAAQVAKETRARRPDLLALRDLIRAYTEDANIARGGYYPLLHIYVTGDLLPEDFVRSDRPNSVRAGDDTRQTEIRPGVQEDWNIIDTGTVRGGVRQLESLRETLSISLRQLEQNVPGELALVRAQLDSERQQCAVLRANVGLSADTLHLIQTGVAQGTNSQLEYLGAQTGVLLTRGGLLAAQMQMSIAHAAYDRATGGYLRFLPATDLPPSPSESRN